MKVTLLLNFGGRVECILKSVASNVKCICFELGGYYCGESSYSERRFQFSCNEEVLGKLQALGRKNCIHNYICDTVS